MTFDEYREEYLEADTFYSIESDGPSYAYSPDGTGLYWYDSMAEMFAQHGQPNRLVNYNEKGMKPR